MNSGIYQIKNLENNKVYVGSSKHLDKRKREHFSMLINNKHHSIKLQRAYNRATNKNIFSFRVLEKVAEDKLFEREQYYIDKLKGYSEGYNCCKFVDNFKNTYSKDLKINKLKKTNESFEIFKKLYSKYKKYIIFDSNIFKDRLINKHYKNPMYNKIIIIINWFATNYNKPYMIEINFTSYKLTTLYIDILDNKNNKFASYKYLKSGIKNSKYDSNLYIKNLKNKYNKNIHYIIN